MHVCMCGWDIVSVFVCVGVVLCVCKCIGYYAPVKGIMHVYGVCVWGGGTMHVR